MTFAQVVDASVIKSSFQNFPWPDDQTKRTRTCKYQYSIDNSSVCSDFSFGSKHFTDIQTRIIINKIVHKISITNVKKK